MDYSIASFWVGIIIIFLLLGNLAYLVGRDTRSEFILLGNDAILVSEIVCIGHSIKEPTCVVVALRDDMVFTIDYKDEELAEKAYLNALEQLGVLDESKRINRT